MCSVAKHCPGLHVAERWLSSELALTHYLEEFSDFASQDDCSRRRHQIAADRIEDLIMTVLNHNLNNLSQFIHPWDEAAARYYWREAVRSVKSNSAGAYSSLSLHTALSKHPMLISLQPGHMLLIECFCAVSNGKPHLKNDQRDRLWQPLIMTHPVRCWPLVAVGIITAAKEEVKVFILLQLSVSLLFFSVCLVLPVVYFVTYLVVSVLGPSPPLWDYLLCPDVFNLCLFVSPPCSS